MSRVDIADFLGLTMETVSRQLTKLRKDGVIHIVNNRHVCLISGARYLSRTVRGDAGF
jgi:CRP/FNR family transcriptional regulator